MTSPVFATTDSPLISPAGQNVCQTTDGIPLSLATHLGLFTAPVQGQPPTYNRELPEVSAEAMANADASVLAPSEVAFGRFAIEYNRNDGVHEGDPFVDE